MKFSNAASLSLLIFCCLSIGNAKANCTLNSDGPMPLQVVDLGSMYVHFYPISNGTYTAATDEKINLFCSQGFWWNGRYNIDQSKLELVCMSNRFKDVNPKTNYEHNYGQLNEIQCQGLAANQVYESKSSLPNCDEYMTLVVGHDLGNFGHLKTVGLCYDIEKPQLRYVSYVAYPWNISHKVLEKNTLGDLESVGMDVRIIYREQFFKPASDDEVGQEWSESHEIKQLFENGTFEYLSIIQEEHFANELDNYSEMFSIAWLHALRVGNWRNFLMALKAASTKYPQSMFQVHVGISGVIEVPLFQHSNDTRILIIETPSRGWATVPAHIWAHIRPLPNKQQPEATIESNEFVFIAHNSPFYRKDGSYNLCKSMCNEIPWLKNSLFGHLHNYFLYGLVECCRITDVARKLDNFPKTVEAVGIEKAVENAATTVAQDETVAQEGIVAQDETGPQEGTPVAQEGRVAKNETPPDEIILLLLLLLLI